MQHWMVESHQKPLSKRTHETILLYACIWRSVWHLLYVGTRLACTYVMVVALVKGNPAGISSFHGTLALDHHLNEFLSSAR